MKITKCNLYRKVSVSFNVTDNSFVKIDVQACIFLEYTHIPSIQQNTWLSS